MAVWNFSENLSVSMWPPVPKMILNVNVSIMIDIFDNIILATLIARKNIYRRWQNKIPMRLSLRSISCENTIQLQNTKEFFAPIRYNALSHILKQIIYGRFHEEKICCKKWTRSQGENTRFSSWWNLKESISWSHIHVWFKTCQWQCYPIQSFVHNVMCAETINLMVVC